MKSFKTVLCLSYVCHGNSFVPAFVKAGKVSFDRLLITLRLLKLFSWKKSEKKILYDPSLPYEEWLYEDL